MEPPVDDHLCGQLRVVVVAAHHAGALDQDLAVLGDPDGSARHGRADRPEARRQRQVHVADRTDLGQPVALDDHQAGGVEPGLDLGVQLRRAGDEEVDVAAHAGFQLAEHQPVCNSVGETHRHGQRPIVEPVWLGRAPDSERPARDPALEVTVGRGEQHRRTNLLEDPWGAAHEGGVHRAQPADDLVDPTVHGRAEADAQLDGEQSLAEDVRQRQPEVLHRAWGDDLHGVEDRRLVDPALVGQLDPFGHAGGAGGVDQGGQAVDAARLDGAVDHPGVLGEQHTPALDQLLPADHPLAVPLAVDQDDVAELLCCLARILQFGQLFGILGDQDHRFGVGDDVAEVIPLRVRVDGRGGPARAVDRVVDQDPLDAGVGGDRHALLRLQSERQQAGREVVDATTGLGPVDGVPDLVGVRVAECLLGGRLRHPPPEQCSHRGLGCLHDLLDINNLRRHPLIHRWTVCEVYGRQNARGRRTPRTHPFPHRGPPLRRRLTSLWERCAPTGSVVTYDC